jgi:hypothetical protein
MLMSGNRWEMTHEMTVERVATCRDSCIGRVTMSPYVHSLHMRIANLRRARWLMRFLSQAQRAPHLSGEDGNHASECLISTGPRLLRRQ